MNEEIIEGEIKGARNLAILAVGAVLVAMATTVVGVYLYVSSGDIYLDRSLPGLLPEISEQEDSAEEQFVFNDYGAVNKGVLGDFLKHFGEAEREVRDFKEPFSDAPLSDDSLIFIVED